MDKKLLVAFDFDHTIIDGNSDIVVRKLLRTTPRECKPSECWTMYMQNVFKLLHEEGIEYQTYYDTITAISQTTNMIDLLKFLNMNDVEVIIISDSNSVFIEMWLSASEIADIKKVYTNPAVFNTSGLLDISMYHSQTWCDICPINLCKGQVLHQYLKDRHKDGITFSHIAYVGDGRNDFCPCTKLSRDDYVFARKGYSLEKLLDTPPKKETDKIMANKHVWSSALDIQGVISAVL